MTRGTTKHEPELVLTGVKGLDDILGGGLTANRLYLVEGDPGTGKTTLGLEFLLEGIRQGESGVYVTLSETRDELEAVARSHGWSLDGITVTVLAPTEETLAADLENTMFHPSELELGETTKVVLQDVERVKPKRVVFDSLSEMRLLAQSSLRYRRQILALKQFFVGRSCTVLLLDDRTSDGYDESRARSRQPGTPIAGIWGDAAPAAGDQNARQAVSSRLSRLQHLEGGP